MKMIEREGVGERERSNEKQGSLEIVNNGWKGGIGIYEEVAEREILGFESNEEKVDNCRKICSWRMGEY